MSFLFHQYEVQPDHKAQDSQAPVAHVFASSPPKPVKDSPKGFSPKGSAQTSQTVHTSSPLCACARTSPPPRMPTPFSTHHLQSPVQMSPPLGSLPGCPLKVQDQFSVHPVYTQITMLFEPYKSSIYFLFQRLCGKFSERTNILKEKRVQWSRGWLLESDTLGTNLALFILLPQLGEVTSLLRLPFSHLSHGMRMGCPLEGVGGMKWLRTVPDTSQRGPREVKRQPPTILNPLVATLKRLKKSQLKLILIMFI